MKAFYLLFPFIIIFSGCDSNTGKIPKPIECINLDSLGQTTYCYFRNTDGEITREGKYIDNLPFGFHKFYKTGRLDYIREYLILINDSSFLNQVYKIGAFGDTIKEQSNFITIKYLNSENFLNDSTKIEIELTAPSWVNSEIEGYFEIPNDTSNIRVISGVKHKLYYSVLNESRGKILLNGQLSEFKIEDSHPGSLPTVRTLYFTLEYIVK